jgi:hypothetical protein
LELKLSTIQSGAKNRLARDSSLLSEWLKLMTLKFPSPYLLQKYQKIYPNKKGLLLANRFFISIFTPLEAQLLFSV